MIKVKQLLHFDTRKKRGRCLTHQHMSPVLSSYPPRHLNMSHPDPGSDARGVLLLLLYASWLYLRGEHTWMTQENDEYRKEKELASRPRLKRKQLLMNLCLFLDQYNCRENVRIINKVAKKVSFKFLYPWPFQSFEIKWAHFYHYELEVQVEFLYKIIKKYYKPDTNACTYVYLHFRQ